MIWLAVIATFGTTFLLVWQLLNWLVGHVRWLPKGFVIIKGEPVSGLPEDSDIDIWDFHP